MTDPFTAASGAIGIISLGITVCQGFINYYSTWKDQDGDIKHTIGSINTLSSILAPLRKALDHQQLDHTGKAQIEQSIESCETAIHSLEKKLNKIRGYQPQSFSSTSTLRVRENVRNFYNRAKYPFKESTLAKLREIVSNARDNLQLAVVVLQLDVSTSALDKLDILQDQGSSTLTKVEHLDKHVTNSEIDAARRRVRKWLLPCDPSTNYGSAVKTHHQGTGQWFLDLAEFIKWKVDHNSFFWAHGIPGCGKTILSSTVIRELKDLSLKFANTTLAYFYFDFQDRSKQQVSDLVRSLITQLADNCYKIPSVVETLYKECSDGNEQPSFVSLLQALRELASMFTDVYIVIDALDECTERTELGRLLQGIYDWNNAGLHVLAMSRKEHDLDIYLSTVVTVQYPLRSDFVDGDIRAFVEYQLENDIQLKSKPNDIRSEILSTITKGANGMFRWADCQLQAIRKCPEKPSLIRKALKSLPKTLDETYERILETIERSDPDCTSEVVKILQWLCFSEEPLSVEELAEALAIETINEPFFDPEDRYAKPYEAVQLCGALVSLGSESLNRWSFKRSRRIDVPKQIVRLSHFSVKEFLTSERMKHQLQKKYGMLDKSAHVTLCKSCIAYLCHFKVECPPSSVLSGRDFPLAVYAAKHWVSHAKKAQDYLHSRHLDSYILNRLGTGDTFKHAVMIYNYDSRFPDESLYDDNRRTEEEWNRRRNITPLSLLYYVTIVGLTSLPNLLIQAGSDVNALGGRLDHPIIAAALHGHTNIIDLLIAAHADLEVSTRIYGTALQAASWNGHLEIIRSLLDAGADINTTSGLNGSPLYAASERDHRHVVSFLIKANAGTEQEDKYGATALMVAIRNGHNDTTRSLLEAKADPDHEAGLSGTPLVTAANVGNVDAVVMLLKAKANVNLESQNLEYRNHMTPLRAAASRGYTKIVHLLLDAGADVHQKSEGYGTVLESAALHDQVEVVRKLLETGADVNAEVGPNKTALQGVAATSNKQKKIEVIELLLANGASVSVEGGRYGSPLQAAAYAGDIKVMELLLAHGAHTSERQGTHGNLLECAAYSINVDAMRFLLDRGSILDEGQVLEIAASNGRTASVEFLLELGAVPKINDLGFLPALQRAVAQKSDQLVSQLGEIHQAVRSGEYSTVLEAAKEKRQKDVFDLLLQSGSKDDRTGFAEWGPEEDKNRKRTESEEREHQLWYTQQMKLWSMAEG